MSLFARSSFKTAARAGASFRAATAITPLRTFQTSAIRKDEANKEDSIHVVHYEKGQRREHDIEVDESKPVIPAVQDVEIRCSSQGPGLPDPHPDPAEVLSPWQGRRGHWVSFKHIPSLIGHTR
jgi:hypothetical protein